MTDNPRATDPDAASLERRVSLVVIVAGLIVWTALLVWLPRRFQGFDEAKYLGIGLNVLAGRGPTTVFGLFFEPHAPLWPIIMAVPQASIGIDAYAWAHALNVAASTTAVGLAAWLGWRIRPGVGALAVASVLAFPYVFELSRRVGLDMPEAALTLGYLAIGGIAVGRGNLRWAVAAGALFALGFLVKELVLSVAPVPFLAAIAAGRPGVVTARVAAWVGLVAIVLTSWWWWVFAAETGRVYRLGTPSWTLLPLLVAALVAIAVGLTWPRMLAAIGRLGSGRGSRGMAAVGGVRLAWGLGLAWALAQTLFFSRTTDLRGIGLFDPGQMAFYLERWLDQLRPLVAIGGIGAALGLGARVVRRRGPGPAVDGLWLALLCSAPVVLLVVGVGDLPRHYVAQMVLLLVIGSAGWLAIIGAAVRRPTLARTGALLVALGAAGVVMAPLVAGRRTLSIALSGLVVVGALGALVIGARQTRRSAAGRWLRHGGAIVTVVVLAFVTAAGSLTVSAAGLRDGSPLDGAKAAAVASVGAWIKAELPPGSTVAFVASLAHETAVELGDGYRVVQVREARDVVVDPDAFLGVVRQGRPPASDWIALSALTRNPWTLDGYQAGTLIEQLRESGTDAWIQVQATDFGEPIVVDAALTPEHGFDRAANWSWPTAAGTLEATIYRVHLERLSFDTTVWTSVLALRRIVEQLEAADSDGARAAAAALLERVRLYPDDPDGPALLERLRVVAGS